MKTLSYILSISHTLSNFLNLSVTSLLFNCPATLCDLFPSMWIYLYIEYLIYFFVFGYKDISVLYHFVIYFLAYGYIFI